MGTYIGRKVPKDFVELAGSIHLGKGIWAFKVIHKDNVAFNGENRK